MKKFITTGFILIVLFGIVTRFVRVSVLQKEQIPPPRDCAKDAEPQFDAQGFEIIQKKPLCHDLMLINQTYLKAIKPIFKAKCLHCHGVVKSLPLYSKIPPISWLVAYDRRVAKEHMDMTFDFPFAGHGTPKDDFKALMRVVNEGKMPPWRYLVMHWKSGLTEKEKNMILQWAKESLSILGK